MTTWWRRSALCVAGAALVAAPLPASADPVDQFWWDALKLDERHEVTQGEGQLICVVDQAIDTSVPDLEGADVTVKVGESAPGHFWAGHGTSMTAMIVGQGDGNGSGGAGILGVAPKAEVWFYAGDTDPATEKRDGESYGDLIMQASEDGCPVVLNAWSGTTLVDDQLEQLEANGTLLVLGGWPDFLGDRPQTWIGVQGVADEGGVVGRDGKIDGEGSFQRFSPPTVMAAGQDIVCGGMEGPEVGAVWQSTAKQQGSSCASAIFAGMLALVQDRWPDATPNQILQAVVHSPGGADNWAFDTETGFGTASLADLFERDPSGWPDENPLAMERDATLETFPEDVWQDPADAPADAADESPDTEPAAATAADDTSSNLPWIGVGALLVVAAVAVILWRRRTAGAPNPSDHATRTGA